MWGPPLKTPGALSGVLVVLGFTVVHDIFVSDIRYSLRRMVFAGALCGIALVWSYNRAVPVHSTRAWFAYSGMYSAELTALGALSLLVLQPRYSMAELLVADDAFGGLLPLSLPFIAAAIVLGTLLIWTYFGRKLASLLSILVTHVLLVFLLGHQFALLGLVEKSTAAGRVRRVRPAHRIVGRNVQPRRDGGGRGRRASLGAALDDAARHRRAPAGTSAPHAALGTRCRCCEAPGFET